MNRPTAELRGLTRRHFLIGGSFLGSGLGGWSASGWSANPQRSRLAVVILRGGLDGLHAVPPMGDPQYAPLRGAVAIPATGENAALKLDSHFGLHPLLPGLHRMYQAGELLVVHAAATPYRERSHFDGQDILENGHAQAHVSADGWLNRALAALPGTTATGDRGVAIGSSLPLLLRGAATVSNWSPSVLSGPDLDFLDRVARLYIADANMAQALARAREVNEDGGPDGKGGMDGKGGRSRSTKTLASLAGAAARFLTAPEGPSAIVLELGGWDSHTAQFNPQGALARNLRDLDAGLVALHDALGSTWARTAVLVFTEFGRTAKPNGSGGTDHGTAAAAFVLGGAVRGGRVLGDWPGLKPDRLYQGRDLRPTTDLRAVAKGLLLEHLRLPEGVVETKVFPDSTAARPLLGLTRTTRST
ncbi:MAG: DUF1501 domain-containing protein [Nevskiales bacterium]|nr:DUF1501 domain-containing protein [Nevskiales bacterium]